MPIGPADYDGLSTFLAEFPGERMEDRAWQARLSSWWDSNPAFEGDAKRGWLLRSNGAIVGMLGVIPSFFQIGGEPVVVHSLTTWRVQPEFRQQSMELLMRGIGNTTKSLLFDATPTDPVVEILRALRFGLIPAGPRSRSFAVTSVERLLRSRVPLPSAVGRLAGLVGDNFLRLPPFRLRGPKQSTNLSVRRLDHADEEFDGLWDRTRGRYQNTNVRTAEAINWYCFANPGLGKELFACYRGGVLEGYLIVREHSHVSIRPLECLDLWTAAGDVDVARALLVEAVRYGRAAGCGIVFLTHFNDLTRRACSEIGMFRQPRMRPREYFRTSKSFQNTISESNSYFTRAQGDYGL